MIMYGATVTDLAPKLEECQQHQPHTEEPGPWHCCLQCGLVSGLSNGLAVPWEGWHSPALQGEGWPQGQAQEIRRPSLVATQGCIHSLNGRSVWQRRYGKVLNTSKKNAWETAPLFHKKKGTR